MFGSQGSLIKELLSHSSTSIYKYNDNVACLCRLFSLMPHVIRVCHMSIYLYPMQVACYRTLYHICAVAISSSHSVVSLSTCTFEAPYRVSEYPAATIRITTGSLIRGEKSIQNGCQTRLNFSIRYVLIVRPLYISMNTFLMNIKAPG